MFDPLLNSLLIADARQYPSYIETLNEHECGIEGILADKLVEFSDALGPVA
jgi:hypothetical protein